MRARLLGLLVAFAWLPTGIAWAVDYAADVKPLLRQHCYRCHGALKQESGLRLDHVSFIRAGGDRGPSLDSNADQSALIQAVTGSGDIEQMPLEAEPLSAEQITTLRTWIASGAEAPDEPLPADPRDHWSFKPPKKPPLPVVDNPAWMTNPIDRLLAAEHEARGLVPTEPAEKHILLRRVYIDLIGIPPTPIEVRSFLADESPDAYRKVVDRLLASPHYGERWGRHWMDVWRYSDWDGYQAEVRESQPHIWRWRDWIIESLNDDKPYDRMILEMLAGDELAPTDPDTLRATGFLVRNWYKFNRNVWLDATVEHTSKAFLGVTLNCARCHDHMYDPIPQTEYYQFRAFFEAHDVRTDRVPGHIDTKTAGLVRVFDKKSDTPTYLFERGNEAAPRKDQPLVPAVPAALGGDPMQIAAVELAPEAYYPGLRSFVRQEELARVEAAVQQCETAMAEATTQLVAARKKLADFVASNQAAPTAEQQATEENAAATNSENTDSADEPTPTNTGPDAGQQQTDTKQVDLNAQVADAEASADVAEQAMLTAAAELVALRARIAADDAAFAVPPAENAADLAREASRAQRVWEMSRARRDVAQAQRELDTARASNDKAAKVDIEKIEKRLAAAKKARDDAQVALGKPGDVYTRFSPVYPSQSTGRRTALARWIASPNNPLASRVVVNHIWMRHFGSPLVDSVFDLGNNGRMPALPTVLDWLAVEFVEKGWRMKPIHRTIVTSAAYRMASTSANESNETLDRENVYLWRMNPRRMEAEVVRDSTLAVAGSLDTTMFGPVLDQESGMTVTRRSIYFRSSKEKKMTFLDLFDRANVTDCYRRIDTVVPQQALAMVNSPLALAQSRLLASRLNEQLAEASSDDDRFVSAAFERVLCRAATVDERDACLKFLDAQAQRLADPAALVAFAAGGTSDVKPSGDPRQRARENLVHVLLNHNDFVTVR